MKTPSVEKIREIIDADPRYYYRTIKREYPDFFERMRSGSRSLAENIYCHINGEPSCQHCGLPKVKFQSISLGFYRYCSNKCSAQAPETRAKYEATSLEKYGAPNPRSSDEVKTKFAATMVERYGVAHALQNETLREKARESNLQADQEAAARKRAETTLSRYGVEHVMHSDIFKEKQKQTNLERFGVDTPLRLRKTIDGTISGRRAAFIENGDSAPPDGSELLAFLKNLVGAEKIVARDRTVCSPREIDILIPSLKIGFEFHGLYWHCDHKVSRNYHLDKLTQAAANGVRLVQIFDSEWRDKRSLVESRIKSLLGQNTRLMARKCEAREIKVSEANAFFEQHHIQGGCVAKYAHGLFYDGVLVAAMTFGKARFDKKADFELLRYASKTDFNVIGGAGKLLAKMERALAPAVLVSYSDRRWNTGGLYKQLGFAHARTSPPNSYYSLDRKVLLSRQLFQKHKLNSVLERFDPNLSESENMYAHGYIRIWDCGQDVFYKTVV